MVKVMVKDQGITPESVHGYGSISGRVISSSDSAVMFAGVKVFKDDTLVTYVISDGDGWFQVDSLEGGTYSVEATYLQQSAFEGALEVAANEVAHANLVLREAAVCSVTGLQSVKTDIAGAIVVTVNPVQPTIDLILRDLFGGNADW
jgi:hypothetical protein